MAGQLCQSAGPSNNALIITKRGTVIDTKHRLEWERCPVGLEGTRCERGATQRFSAVQAHDFVAQGNRGRPHPGTHGWRLPTQAELRLLVINDCVSPATNLNVFPRTPSTSFWASEFDGGNAAYVDFGDGHAGFDDVNLPNPIRKVRSWHPR